MPIKTQSRSNVCIVIGDREHIKHIKEGCVVPAVSYSVRLGDVIARVDGKGMFK